MKPIVQISLDLTNINEAIETARMAIRAGVDWLEAGTPLILAEGLHGIRALRSEFPNTPIVADLKTMDGGYLEAEMMAGAGATHVVVMARAHEETIRCVVKAGRDFGIQVMGDNMICTDMVAAASFLKTSAVILLSITSVTMSGEVSRLVACGCLVHSIGFAKFAMRSRFPFKQSVGCRSNKPFSVLRTGLHWLFWVRRSPSMPTRSRPLTATLKLPFASFATQFTRSK